MLKRIKNVLAYNQVYFCNKKREKNAHICYFRIFQTQIQSNDDPSYQPLVTISDNDNTE